MLRKGKQGASSEFRASREKVGTPIEIEIAGSQVKPHHLPPTSLFTGQAKIFDGPRKSNPGSPSNFDDPRSYLKVSPQTSMPETPNPKGAYLMQPMGGWHSRKSSAAPFG